MWVTGPRPHSQTTSSALMFSPTPVSKSIPWVVYSLWDRCTVGTVRKYLINQLVVLLYDAKVQVDFFSSINNLFLFLFNSSNTIWDLLCWLASAWGAQAPTQFLSLLADLQPAKESGLPCTRAGRAPHTPQPGWHPECVGVGGSVIPQLHFFFN